MGMLRRWWRQPDHFGWLSGYLADRGISGAVRVLMATIMASFVLCLLALLTTSDGPHGTVPVAMTWVAAAIGAAGAVLWTWRWPTRTQGIAFALACNLAIALACLAHPNPLAALIGCIAFATIGGYIAFFHGTALVMYNFAVAAAVAIYQAIRLGVAGHPALAAVDSWLVVQVNIALPVAIQVLVRALSADLLHADRDPLTGLLNRRAFQRHTLGLIMARHTADAYLIVSMIDLDDFKAINDTHGHTVGDEALVHVSKALLTTTGDTAVIARSGGEEFLVAHTSPTNDARGTAQRMRQAIAASPASVTASIGTACTPLVDELIDNDQHSRIDELITVADLAMYEAKRRGGNQVHSQHLDTRATPP